MGSDNCICNDGFGMNLSCPLHAGLVHKVPSAPKTYEDAFDWRDGIPYCKKHGTRLLGRLGTSAGGGMYCLECAGKGQTIAVGTPYAYLSQRTYEQGRGDGLCEMLAKHNVLLRAVEYLLSNPTSHLATKRLEEAFLVVMRERAALTHGVSLDAKEGEKP